MLVLTVVMDTVMWHAVYTTHTQGKMAGVVRICAEEAIPHTVLVCLAQRPAYLLCPSELAKCKGTMHAAAIVCFVELGICIACCVL